MVCGYCVVLLHSLYGDTLDFLIVVWDGGLCWWFDLLFVWRLACVFSYLLLGLVVLTVVCVLCVDFVGLALDGVVGSGCW